jgi:hypothetical protein
MRVVCDCWYPIPAVGSDAAGNALIRDVEIDCEQALRSGNVRDDTGARIGP